MKKYFLFGFILSLYMSSAEAYCGTVRQEFVLDYPVTPVLVGKTASPVFKLASADGSSLGIEELHLDFSSCTDFRDVETVCAYGLDQKGFPDPENKLCIPEPVLSSSVVLKNIDSGDSALWIAVTLKPCVSLDHKIAVKCRRAVAASGRAKISEQGSIFQRIGVAVRQKGQDGVASSRIPGLATASDGTLIAIFDARHDSSRDLQGDIDIAAHRSFDGGCTWQPMQTVLDMGPWGGLPEKYNGVSDACILVNETNGDIFVAGLWMYGVLDDNGKWTENLTENSTEWMHQWRNKGSQPGFDVKQTSQFIITRSSDNGATWGIPENITWKTKKAEWWLYAPAPGRGITMSDGTLVFPTQGRDKDGRTFSNITWSRDNGRTWVASNPAFDNVTECNVAELSDRSLMLNMRDNRNRGVESPNGRRICTTTDLGSTWTEHPSSHKILTEPTCMASLYRHDYYDAGGRKKSILLFVNPDDYAVRDKLTLKVSFDDGSTWPEEYYILFDQYRSAGYSSITSVDNDRIGILYEGSQAELVFIRISLDEILKKH